MFVHQLFTLKTQILNYNFSSILLSR